MRVYSASDVHRIRTIPNLLVIVIWMAALVCPCSIYAVPAQQSTGQQRIPGQKPAQKSALEGNVQASDGGAVVGANVVLRNLESGVQQEKLTDAEGTFRLIELQPGTYELKIVREGFEEYVEPTL